MTLAREGFSIEYTTPQNNGTTIIELKKDGDSEKYFGIVNSDFQWVMAPTSNIVKFDNFQDGYAAAAIQDTREMRSVSNDDGELWGYLDKDGKWAIQPQYAEARLGARRNFAWTEVWGINAQRAAQVHTMLRVVFSVSSRHSSLGVRSRHVQYL